MRYVVGVDLDNNRVHTARGGTGAATWRVNSTRQPVHASKWAVVMQEVISARWSGGTVFIEQKPELPV
jgi:hypothetical protein